MAHLFLWPQHAVEDIIYHTTFGETRKVRLKDESIVLLNADSTLICSGDWGLKKGRTIALKGE